MPAYGGPRYTIVQLLHRMWPRRSTIAELMPHCATPGEFSASHHPEGPSPGSLKNITPLTFDEVTMMPFASLLAALGEIRDPRRPQGRRYTLAHLLLFSILAVLAAR
jgi:hypothetical protein